jgi:protein-tyrosine-phosphatase
MLEKKVKDLNKQIEVYSCGIYAEFNDLPTDNAIKIMHDKYGIDLKSHKSTNIRKSDIEEMDIILCATKAHKSQVLNMYPQLNGKIYTMKEYAGYSESDWDIKDPWGYDMETYKMCAKEISDCIDIIIEKI